VIEALGGANLGFTLMPMLTAGAVEALVHHGTPDQRARFLPRMISGEWSGTMNLTEPQAGSDVGALRTRATPIREGEHAGHYRIKGTKIFISWGEHELTDNVIQLVLARLPDAPPGTRGISLFVVPRYRLGPDGARGARNDVKATSLEHKFGLHASPTCVMSYGDEDDCIGELVGAENEGLKAMFTMMNTARIGVGNQGVQVAEAALQHASAYALTRVQSARAGAADKTSVAIVEHADVRRMLLRMRALTEAARALLYHTAGEVDRAALGDEAARTRVDLLTPLVKSWCTDMACEVASLGVQVHGGMGFIEETGAARHYRDARILPIYEGTNGIQAMDLVTRKLGIDGGAAFAALMSQIVSDARAAERFDGEALASLAEACTAIGKWMRDEASLDDKLAGSVPFQTMGAVAVAGWQLLRQATALDCDAPGGPQARRKGVVARFFLSTIVGEAHGLRAAAMMGSGLLYALGAAELAA
jgi:alkylation response protein AidB-like acyl-CoA dehydrogenase